MDLTTSKGDLVPIKAIPEAQLNAKILNELTPWLTQLLSIKPTDDNVERLEVLLPMVKDNCWSMPISEIKKAFTMYVQGKLPIEPRDNYLTAILFSKVIEHYKQSQPKKKPTPIDTKQEPEEEKKTAIENIMAAYEHYSIMYNLPSSYYPAYDRLREWGLIKDPNLYPKYMQKKMLTAGGYAIAEKLDERKRGGDATEINKAIEQIRKYAGDDIQRKFKVLVLGDFFDRYKTREELKKKIDELS